MKASRLVLIGFIVLLSAGVFAEEGMWMPQQIPALAAKLRALGFTGDPKSFADLTGQPMGAIVSLGGCTASFVSPDGLIVTNHHCVTGGLQFNSTPQRNLLKDGFFAPTLADELSNGPGSRVFVTTSVVEVTGTITGGIDGRATDRERYDTIDRRVKERIAACEQDGSRCNVASFFEGRQYFEIKQLEIKDVRLVYAPAEGIGVFGGETDNWRWPRHTGDWSYLRAYVGKDGRPAAYDKGNVPYRPKHWLKVAAGGVKPNDLVFVVGYPGRTQRHQTYGEVKETVEWALPRSIRLSEEQLALIETLTKENPALAIKLAGRVQGLNNGLTNSRGVLEGMMKGGALAKKQAREAELVAWISASPARQQKYGEALSALQALQAQGEATRERNAALGLLSSASSYLGSAQTLYRLSVQRAKPDVARDPGYQERDWTRIREGQDRLQRSIDPVADRALLSWAMHKAAALPAGQRVEPLDKAAGLTAGMDRAAAEAAVKAFLDGLYAGTKLADREVRLGMLERSTADSGGLRRRVHRAGRRPGTAGRGEPRERQEPGRRLRADQARLHGSHAREGRRPRGPRRQQHAARDLRPGEGRGHARRALLQTADDASGHRGEAHGQRRLRRPAEAARRHQGVAGRQDNRVRRQGRERRTRQLPVHRGHDRGQLGIADPECQGRVRGTALRRDLRVRVVGLPVRQREDPVDPRGQPLHAVDDGRGRRREAAARRDEGVADGARSGQGARESDSAGQGPGNRAVAGQAGS